MKKIIICVFLLTFIVLFSTACEGDVTRALRHQGFTVAGDIECKMLYNGKEGDKIRYFTGNKLISEDGKIYDISLDRKYSTDSNCKLSNTELRVVSLFDNKVFKATDGKFYLLNTENSALEYQEITNTDNSYKIFEVLLGGNDVVKVTTADSTRGIYYVLKNDGNVYAFALAQDDSGKVYVDGTTVVYSSSDYGGAIVDYNFAGDSASTFVRTNTNKVYFMQPINAKECSRYADVVCNYQMEEAPFFEKYYEYVLVYNGSTVITTYGRVFNVIG